MKLRDLLELCRVSNLPTVWSNSVVGLLAGVVIFDVGVDFDDPSELGFLTAFATLFALAMSLIYSGGMVMNDWVDLEVDAKERPGRPIPSGRVSAKTARNLAILMFFWGVVIVMLIDGLGALCIKSPEGTIAALLLVSCVVLYNYAHQRSPLAIVFMALCRSLIIVCGVLIAGPCDHLFEDLNNLWFVVGPAATLFLYTLAISIVARREVDHAAQPRRSMFLPRWFGGPKTIMNMIAAMPLLDAAWLVVMGLWPASLFCVACAGLTKLGHRRVAGS